MIQELLVRVVVDTGAVGTGVVVDTGAVGTEVVFVRELLVRRWLLVQ